MLLLLGIFVLLVAGGVYLFLQQKNGAPKSQRKELNPPSTRTAVQGSIRKKIQKPESELKQRDLFAEFLEQEGPSPATSPRKVGPADSLHSTGGSQPVPVEASIPAPSVLLNEPPRESGSAVAVEANPLPASIPMVPPSIPVPDQIASPGIATAKQIPDGPTTDVVTAQSIASPIPTDPGTPSKDVQTALNIPSPAALPVDITQASQRSQTLEVEKTQAGSSVASSGEEVSKHETGSKKVGKRRKMLGKKKAKNTASKTGSNVTATASSKKGKKQKKKKKSGVKSE